MSPLNLASLQRTTTFVFIIIKLPPRYYLSIINKPRLFQSFDTKTTKVKTEMFDKTICNSIYRGEKENPANMKLQKITPFPH
jgi:hypothetical protein